MEYELSKVLPILVYPIGLTIQIVFVVALLARRKIASLLAVLAVVILWISGTTVFADWLLGTLENEFPPTPIEDLPNADAIVVLGGGTGDVLTATNTVELGDASARVFHAAQVFQADKAPLIVVAGGAPEDELPESVAMRRLLIAFGVPEQAILQETQSRNTWQNTLNSKAILQQHNVNRVLLITSAFHMRRAIAVFEAAGIDASPAPTDYRAIEPNHTFLDWLPHASALFKTTYAIKEHIGLIVYRWRGWAA